MVIRCKACGAQRQDVGIDELQAALACPCGNAAEGRAAEDLASAVEDALAQLWWVERTHDLQLTLDTDQIPFAFVPAPSGDR